jgi:hypothetical protein
MDKCKRKEKTASVRSFTQHNLNNFKIALNGSDWTTVLNSTDVNAAYDEFWSIYSDLYELTFPQKKVRFNKNFHKQSPFMTAGLLISRQTKNNLFKIQLVNKTLDNVTKYKNYKQIYFKTIRAAKKLYFRNKLRANVNNPKKPGRL